jgi:YVTN family beta-propeller protein
MTQAKRAAHVVSCRTRYESVTRAARRGLSSGMTPRINRLLPWLALLGLARGAAAQPARPPARDVPDPGVVSTGQRITPAGVQTVFDGRVGGVRFGATSADLWVAVPGSLYHLAWSDGRVLGRAAFDGRAGVYGVAVDPATGRALVSSVGRLPRTPGEGRQGASQPAAPDRSVAQLAAFGDGGRAATFGPLGESMAGGPAVARVPNAAGRRVAVLPLTANDRLAVVDLAADTGGGVLPPVDVGVAPVAAALSADGAVAYVTTLGGRAPRPGERAASQCCAEHAGRVRVDARGIAAAGALVRVDLAAGAVTHTIPAGLHPTALVWDEPRGRLFVANGNSDELTVVDTRRNAVAATVAVTPFRERARGLAPTALALAPDGRTLYVALGGANAVAVYDVGGDDAAAPLTTLTLRGLVPTGWYPSTLDVSPDGKYLAVGTLLGVGSGEGSTDGSPGKRGRFVHAVRGSVHVVAAPTAAELAGYTRAVAANNRMGSAPSLGARGGASSRPAPPRPVPERVGDPSPITHVVYVVKENRTYDQVLGDLPRGAGDTSLVIFGRDVTPNHHALAEQFVTVDHFFATGGNSADGHQWLTQANETDYTLWPLYEGRSYPFDGSDPLAYSSGGFLWEAAQAKGKSVAVFGEFAPSLRGYGAAPRAALLAEYRAPHAASAFRARFGKDGGTTSEIPSLDRALVRDYPAYSVGVPDVVRADIFLDHLAAWESAKQMPNLVMVQLPSDHTSGTRAGWCTPAACVADNDLALGRIVEGLSRSSFWPSMAVFVVEDDAQNGVDHVDGHRTVALVASPYAKRGAVDTTFYNHPSLVKTIELVLGLPALSMFDLVATDMRASFRGPDEAPDLRPFTALEPAQSIYAVNPRADAITGPDSARRVAAERASSRMRFDVPDAAPSDALNRILWHAARGWRAPYPGVRRSVFQPMTVDLGDDEREEEGERERGRSAPRPEGPAAGRPDELR